MSKLLRREYIMRLINASSLLVPLQSLITSKLFHFLQEAFFNEFQPANPS